MARLRSRLIGGAGQPEVGFLSGVAQGLNRYAEQMAAEQDPDVQMARQLRQLRIQAMQGQLQAQQQEQEAMAGYRKLGEDIVPEAGTQVPTEAQGPGAGQVLGTFAGEPTANDRMLKAMIQSGNPQLLAKAQAQFAPQEPQSEAGIVEIGGEKYIRQPNGNLVHVTVKSPADKTLNENEVINLVASNGALRGPTIPTNMTPEQGKAWLKEKRSLQQQALNIRVGEAAAKHSSQPLINRESGEVEFPSGDDLASNPGKWIKVPSGDMTMYGLLRNIGPQVEGMKSLLDKVLVEGAGKNLVNAVESITKRGGGSTSELAAWDVLKSDITIENTRALAGSARPPVMLLKLVRGQLPTTASNISAAKTELELIQANADNRMRGIRGMAPRPLPVPTGTQGGPSGPPPAGTKWQRNTRTGEIRAMPIGP